MPKLPSISTITASLAQDRYQDSGPNFSKHDAGASTAGLTLGNGCTTTSSRGPTSLGGEVSDVADQVAHALREPHQ